ncbi:bifunctional DNA-formamidopyrimidine glycosylase/DNA-(apurinic or apyrimidinic site) lyase [Candidatus Saccharibacteria bacterium]|nr:bifunctional DNA-formamidopyrimidine glycosylase/DNA-(apurinic or apyrimidinic site) lyase [Candidatus Saccharibacteria bacterium]MCB9834540.1 bifunctional DNA-formamidopyrimidine glycosylase/DNA-(apurinic or apyrimidinic site) lyase [Candidatus Nomurabacteria bacterium]
MPELPEVEIVRRGLGQYLGQQKIVDCQILSPKSFRGDAGKIVGARILWFDRKGKLLVIGLDNSYSVLIHLRMTGQLIVVGKDHQWGAGHPNHSLIGKMPDRSTRVIIQLEDYSLYFNDLRKFGYIELWPTNSLADYPFIKKLAPDIVEISLKGFENNLKRKAKSSIKAALLDQTVVAGIGNIYADEATHSAGVRPDRLVSSLSVDEIAKVYQAANQVIKQSIELGGSTSRNYLDVDGKKGKYLDFAQVYNREGQPCKTCSAPIVKVKHAGRGTHYCPNCQK